MITTPIPHTNLKNGQPPLDNTRPFMDDTGRPRSWVQRSFASRTEPVDLIDSVAFRVGSLAASHCWVAPALTCGSVRMLAASAGVSLG